MHLKGKYGTAYRLTLTVSQKTAEPIIHPLQTTTFKARHKHQKQAKTKQKELSFL